MHLKYLSRLADYLLGLFALNLLAQLLYNIRYGIFGLSEHLLVKCSNIALESIRNIVVD